jgi:hypothetical protein
MGLVFDEFELTESAYRHGFDDGDAADMLRGRHLVIRNRRGRLLGYEILGRNAAGAYLLAAGRVVESAGSNVLRIFHLNLMSDPEKRRFRKMIHNDSSMTKRPGKNTRAEDAYIRDLERRGPLEKLERGDAELVAPSDYPAPLQRFLARERNVLRVQLSPAQQRKAQQISRATGIPIDELARRWVQQGLSREAS